MSSVITISQPPSIPGDKKVQEKATAMTFAPMDPDMEHEDLEVVLENDSAKGDGDSETGSESYDDDGDTAAKQEARAQAINLSLEKLQSGARSTTSDGHLKVDESDKRKTSMRRRLKNGPDAVIVLKEERVSVCDQLLHCTSLILS